MSLLPQVNGSLKIGSISPCRLVPEFFNEFPLPATSSTIADAHIDFAIAIFDGLPVRYPPYQSPSAAASTAAIMVKISVHPTLPNTIQVSISSLFPAPPKRFPWIKDASGPAPPASPPFISVCASDQVSFVHHPLLNTIEISFAEPSLSISPSAVSPLPQNSTASSSPGPSLLTLHFLKFDQCAHVCKAICHSLTTRSSFTASPILAQTHVSNFATAI